LGSEASGAPSASDDAAVIGRFCEHLRLERRLSDHTVSAYRRDLTQLSTFLSRQGRSLGDVDRAALRRYLSHQATLGYARSSIARRVGAIRTFYRWAEGRGVVASNPAAELGRPKVVSRLPVVLRDDEAARLVEAPARATNEREPVGASTAAAYA
jgi:integrase/recombinase XerC